MKKWSPPLLEVPEGAGETITKYSGREEDQNGEQSKCDQKRSKSETEEAFQGRASCKGDQEKEKNNGEEQEAEELRLEEEKAKLRQTFELMNKEKPCDRPPRIQPSHAPKTSYGN